MSYNDLLKQKCNLLTSYSSQNEWGDWTYTYSSAASDTSCRMTAVSEYETLEQFGRHDDIRYFGYFQSSAAIREGEQLTFNGDRYIIREVIVDAEGHHKECLISELKV